MKFFNTHAQLADKRTFKRFLAPLHHIKWVVYCKDPFAGPQQVLPYLSHYTHRVAISNRRFVAADAGGIAFRWKDYRIDGTGRWKTMTLTPHEFIRRFLMHVLPKGFIAFATMALFANGNRAKSIAKARKLLAVKAAEADQPCALTRPCPCCGWRMLIIETFAPGCVPKCRPNATPPMLRIDTS